MVFEHRDLGDENASPDATGDSRELQDKRSRMDGRRLTPIESHLLRLRIGITAAPLSLAEVDEITQALEPEFRDFAMAHSQSWKTTQEKNKVRLVQAAVAAYQALLMTERK